MKEITINDKKYKIDCNAFTYVKYPSFFENGIIDDMNIVRNYLVKQTLLVNKYMPTTIIISMDLYYKSGHDL